MQFGQDRLGQDRHLRMPGCVIKRGFLAEGSRNGMEREVLQ
jgi:hypothetical protein